MVSVVGVVIFLAYFSVIGSICYCIGARKCCSRKKSKKNEAPASAAATPSPAPAPAAEPSPAPAPAAAPSPAPAPAPTPAPTAVAAPSPMMSTMGSAAVTGPSPLMSNMRQNPMLAGRLPRLPGQMAPQMAAPMMSTLARPDNSNNV